MTKYYISSEKSWQIQKKKQEKIGRGIDVLYSIDRYLDRAFEQLEYDKYGLMSRNTYSSKRSQISACEKKNNALYNYAKSIHEKVEDKDFDFFKALNKAYEELSILDITEYKTKNTLKITERKTIPISYYSGNMAYQSGIATSYETRDVLKSSINIYDIQIKCDIFQYEKQLKDYLKENGKTLTQAEIKEAKENFYKGTLVTEFSHERYTEGWRSVLSTTLDFIPIVGGVKNVIEGCTGYTMTGEKLKDSGKLNYIVLGTLTTAIDAATLGVASGVVQGGKFIGKEAAKASIKTVTKVALQQTTGSVIIGWTSQFASERLKDMGLSSEEIFAIHVIVGITMAGVSKYKNSNKTINEGASGAKSPYSHLEDPPNVGAGKDFTQTQKSQIIEENMNRNNGVVKSDMSGQELVRPQKSQKGVTPPKNEWQIDHITPKDKGGTNSFENAQVLSREENRAKWNK